MQLEERYSKPQILSAYLNAVYFGDGYHGVEAASRGYFRQAGRRPAAARSGAARRARPLAQRLLADASPRTARWRAAISFCA